MGNKEQDTDYTSVVDDGTQVRGSSSIAMPPGDQDSEDLSLDPRSLGRISPEIPPEDKKTNLMVRMLKRADVVLVALLVLGLIGLVANTALQDKPKASQANVSDNYDTQQIPLESFVVTEQGVAFDVSSVVINGTLLLNDGVILTPTQQPVSPTAGQLYYDKTSNQLNYYNGTEFISVVQQGSVVQSIGGVTGAVTLGGGLSVVGNQLVATQSGVSSFGGQTGAITVGNGLSMSGNTIANGGVVSLTPGTVNLTVTNDGNGNLTISSVGGGTGTVTSGGGTAGRIAKFTGVQNVEDSLLSESGATITVNGNLAVTGSVSLSNALTVPNGGTGTTTLTANGVLVGQGAAAITAVTGSPGDCLVVNGGGSPVFGACSGGSTVTSLNSLTGALTIADSTGLGSTITINDATTASKGIASFNATNFTAVAGAVNTVQNINSGATPTFAGVNTNSITPSAALTVGATGQALTLQGNGGTVLTATNGGNTTTISFQAPTANVTYRFATAGAGTYDVCTTTGNCAGVGGGVTTAGGAVNQLAKFTAGSAIGNSSISDDGTNVITTSDVVVQGGSATLGVANTQTGTLTLAYGSANFSGTIIQGALASANRTYTLPDADGTFCLSSGNCLGGGGGGANSSLSNLTGVAINTTLLPGVAGTVNLGSGTLPFGDLFIAGTSGTPGTNNFRITGASTGGTRTITLPDETGTVCTNAAGSATCQGNFILNQNGSDQTGNFRISGSGQANTSLLTPLLDTQAGTTVLAIGTNNATGGINLNQTTTVAANRNFVMASGTGTFAQTYTGTGTAHTITANSLTTGSAFSVNSTNNTVADTAWSGILINATSAQSGTAVTTGTIAGFDVQFTQGTSVAGNIDTVANFAVKRNDSASTDQTVTSILNLANLDTATGNQVNVTDGIKINGGANIANALNLSGTFNTNLIASTNLTVAASGAITTAGDAAINGGDITSTTALNITPAGALTLSSAGAGNDIVLNSIDTIELQDATNVTGAFSASTTISLGTLGAADTSTFVCRNSSNQLAACLTGGAGAAFIQDGNTFGATAVLGTNDNFGLNLEVNNTVVATFSTAGAANFRNVTDSTAAFNIEEDGGGNLFTVDTTNSRVGINLGGANTPTLAAAGQGLELQGALRLSGDDSAFRDTYTTPTSVGEVAKVNIVNQTLPAFSQVIAMGLLSGSHANSRAIGVYDARTVAHQPSIAVFSVDESDAFGLSWEGGSSDAYLKTLAGDINLRVNTTDVANFASNAVNLLQNTSVTGTLAVSTLGTTDTSTFLCRNTANQLAGCSTTGAGAAFVQGGNTFGATAVLGTNDNFGLNLEVNNGAIATFSNTGAANFANTSNSTQAFNVENSSGGNLFTIDTTNSEVGINLGGGVTPSIGNAGLQVNGSIKMTGSGFHTFTTPNGANIDVDFSITPQALSAFSQVMALGADNTAHANSRVLSLFDDRGSSHQPTLLVFDPTENNGIGFNWNGSSTTANVQTLDLGAGNSAEIVVRSGNIAGANGSSGAVYLQSGGISGGTGGSTGAVFIQSGNGTGTDSSSGNIAIDTGSATGSGTIGTITIGGTNASALTLGRTGFTTTNAGRLAVNGSTTGDALTVTNSTSTGAIAIFKDNATNVFTIGDGGAVTLQNETNQLNALQILTTVGSGGNTVFNADTINQRVGIGGVAAASKFEVQGGDAAIYNSGNNPRLILGDSTSAGQNGFLQWDSTNDYIRLETTGTNGLKVNDNFVSIGNLFPDQPLKVGNGSTLLAQINTTGQALFQNSADSSSAFRILNSGGHQLFSISTSDNPNDLITNGSLETDTTDWAGLGSSSIARITTQQYVGLASLQVDTTAASGDGAKYNITLSSSTQYTVSFYAKLSSGTFTNMSFGYSSDGVAETDCKASQQIKTNGWSSFNCSFTTGTVSGSPYFYWKQNTGVARTVYVDALQMVLGQDIGAYHDGKINTGGMIFSGPVAIQNDNDSNTPFQIQSSGGTTVFGADALNFRVGVNLISPTAALHVTTIGTTSVTALFNQSVSSTEDIFQLSKANDITASVTHDGQTTFQNLANSTTAFRVLGSNATFGSGVPLFVADTTNSRVYVGNPTGDTTGALLVLDTKTDSGDPTGVSGGLYYNSNSGKFRCYIAAWADCMTPGGSTTEIQFNDGGSMGGDADLVWDKTTNAMTLGGTDTGIVIAGATNEPSAPSSGNLRFYTKSIAGRMMPKWKGPTGAAFTAQPAIFGSSFSFLSAAKANGNVDSLGMSQQTSGPCTINGVTIASTNLRTSMRRNNYASGAGANSFCEFRNAGEAQVWRGNAAGLGGFFMAERFAVTTTTTNQRFFVGFNDNLGSTSSTLTPSNLTNAIIVGWDSADTNLQVMHNDGSGTATKVDLGANFPTNTTAAVYDVRFYAPPNGSTVGYEVTRLDTGDVASGTISTDLPSSTTFLAWHTYINNGGTAASSAFDFMHLYIESDY